MAGLTLIAVGKLKEKFYMEACAEYEKRLGAFGGVRVIELPEGKTRAAEAEAIRAKLPKNAWLAVFTPEGKKYSSEGFAALIAKTEMEGRPLCFLIGSSEGMDESLKAQADAKISVSDMTFPHHLFRVMALEQLYRARSILAGGKYHK